MGAVIAALMSGIPLASASPWVEIGDDSARRDVELLHAHGLIDGPIASWPLPWPQIIDGIDDTLESANVAAHIHSAAQRLREKYAAQVLAPNNGWRTEVRVRASSAPALIRDFSEPARDKGEASVSLERVWDNLAVRLSLGVTSNFDGDTELVLDDSYIAHTYGNVVYYAGFLDQWWGPGRDGALQLSSNAHPFPVVGASRMEARAFESPLLSWIGPWRLAGFAGVLNDDDRGVDNPFFAGMRAEIAPIKGLSLGASRTIQLCGEGIPCGADDIFNAVIGSDNNTSLGSTGTAETGSDQKAGFDVRYSRAIGAFDFEGYLEVAGEDQAGFLPSKLASLAGVGIGFPVSERGDRFHAYAEIADTEVNDGLALFFGSSDETNVFYTNALYPSGNTYEGDVIGHSIESDSMLITLGGAYDTFSGKRLWGRVGYADLNTDGTVRGDQPTNFPAAQDLALIDVGANIPLPEGRGEVTLGFSYLSEDILSEDRANHEYGGSLGLKLAF